ncbi:MAG: aldo/keto reductase [Vampirovibrionales bacterium]
MSCSLAALPVFLEIYWLVIKGYATPEGTARYAQRAVETKKLPPEHFRLTATGHTLSSLGMGSYLGEPDDEDSEMMESAVRRSVTSGAVNVLDTAINYRYQASEVTIGRALADLIAQGALQRDEVFVASKNGFLTPDYRVNQPVKQYMEATYLQSGVVDPKDVVGGMHCISPSFLADQLQRSLDNLGLETLDLLYLHNVAESQLPYVAFDTVMDRLETAFTFLEGERQAGRLRYYGLATWNCFRVDPDESADYLSLEMLMDMVEAIGGPDHGLRYMQLPYNYAYLEAFGYANQPLRHGDHHHIVTTCQAAQALGVGLFASVPLFQGQLLTQAPSMRPFRKSLDKASLSCLQFVRSTPGILAPLVGHKQPAHVEENLRVAWETPLNDAEFATFLSHEFERV